MQEKKLICRFQQLFLRVVAKLKDTTFVEEFMFTLNKGPSRCGGQIVKNFRYSSFAS